MSICTLHVRAIAFAVRAGHTDAMAYRFARRVSDLGKMGRPEEFPAILAELMRETESYG